jgi:hypothetical protein
LCWLAGSTQVASFGPRRCTRRCDDALKQATFRRKLQRSTRNVHMTRMTDMLLDTVCGYNLRKPWFGLQTASQKDTGARWNWLPCWGPHVFFFRSRFGTQQFDILLWSM